MSFNNQIVVKFRFVAHTMGLAGWDKSRNHWSIYLILRGNSTSVRLNMSLANGSDEVGTFTANLQTYIVSNSTLTYFDYEPCANLTVGHCLSLIRLKGRERYRMTGSGNGCRYWV
ncbi:hypothetical protein N7523_005549 [Penicillium sp. IBT 18751x]|nr:hypothetical protein N7523_005549 [Penicillium sp. IBT 18751x]